MRADFHAPVLDPPCLLCAASAIDDRSPLRKDATVNARVEAMTRPPPGKAPPDSDTELEEQSQPLSKA